MLSELRTEIINLFGLYPNQKLELEAKFGTVRDNSFRNEIPFSYFDRLRSSMSRVTSPTVSRTTDESDGTGLRKTITSGNELNTWMRKEKKWEYDSLVYGVRLSLNIEHALNEIPSQWQYNVLRVKNRWSFLLDNGNYRLDMTEVDQTLMLENISSNRYEIELELLNILGLDNFFSTLNRIFKAIYDTEELWTYPERDNLIAYINQLMGGKPNTQVIDTSTIRQARNLRWEDLVYGGIVGNPEEEYAIYHKVDGVRKLLVCAPSGVWLVYPHLEFNKVSSEVNRDTVGSILFVENIPPENRKLHAPSAKYWIVVYDCAATDGSNNIGQQRLGIRSAIGQKITDLLKEQFEERLLDIGTLRYRVFTTVEGFFTVCREFLNEQNILKYGQDGLIFAPIFAPVQHHSDKLPLSERVLTVYPDSCKWKPSELLTNDLSLKWIADPNGTKTLDVECVTNLEEPFLLNGKIPPINRMSLLKDKDDMVMTFYWNLRDKAFTLLGESRRSYPLSLVEAMKRFNFIHDVRIPSERKKKTVFDFRIKVTEGKTYLLTSSQVKVPFRGTEDYPFDSSMISNVDTEDNISLEDLPTAAVVEFKYIPNTKSCIGQNCGVIVPYRLRPDKTLPNRLDIAQDNWIQVRNPISEETLMGETFNMLDKYIERTFYETINLIPDKESVLLIMGDVPLIRISEIKQFKILDISEDLLGLELRLNEIRSGKYSCIFFYRALEDIWSQEVLSTIEQILPIGGLLVNLGLNGDTIKHLFNPEIRGPITDKISIYPEVMEYHEGYVKIYPEEKNKSNFEVKRLTSLFPFLIDFKLEESFRLDEEQLLHLGERLMGTLYSVYFLNRSSTEHRMKIQPLDYPISKKEAEKEQEQEKEEIPSAKIVPGPLARLGGIPQEIVPISSLPPEGTITPIPISSLPPEGTITPIPISASTLPSVPISSLPISSLPISSLPISSLPISSLPISSLPISSFPISSEDKAIKINIEERNLPMLRVTIPKIQKNLIRRGVVAAGDDTFEYVKCSWYNDNKVVRIATIGDGSCFFHGVLKAYYPEYQENNEAVFRIDLIRRFRRDLAVALTLPSEKEPESTYYEITGNGIFVELAEEQKLNPDLIRDLSVDFTLKGLQQLLNSSEDVGDTVYQYVSDMIGVDVYVLRGTTQDLYPHLNTSLEGQVKRSVIIMGNKYHYEVIGIQLKDTDKGSEDTDRRSEDTGSENINSDIKGLFQTMFPSTHPFLSALRKKFDDVGGFR